MHKALALIAPAAAMFAAVPAGAQASVYEPQYNLAYDRLSEESARIAEIQAELGTVSDFETGCRLLSENLAHLQEADRLLGELINYSEQLSWRKQRESAEEKRTTVQADIELTNSNIANNCADQL